ncbi:related to Na+/H+-exchanging protein [Cephalotrichum gorgonifer]|uniref:Related to Na+/H+-exchanging protein n=1 Tax=Cephalotrichum gorgonifer TaxID=2041049 RepID=A0AAE8SWU7_9PEZI|nr:related to Na+/H+-exchanging protein [Cephalotrichum gorgonifer]
MPTLDVSELNVAISILGAFIVLFGLLSIKIKGSWYLGEALPSVIVGIALGPVGANFIHVDRWVTGSQPQISALTLGIVRMVIGIQVLMAGYQLPAKYQLHRWKEMMLCLLPVMTGMWLLTCGCIIATVPKITTLIALCIAACVTPTDPVLSQSIAKGPFADKYVPRPLREIISSEAGANDGFAFPFLMLATYLIRHADIPIGEDGVTGHISRAVSVLARSGEIGRLGGGPGEAMKHWFLETWLYMILVAPIYGATIGYLSSKAIHYCLRRKWINDETFLIFPTAIGLFVLGTAGSIGISDLLACFAAGTALNWDGKYLAETELRHDEVNNAIDLILNVGGFMYIGVIIPWSEFHQPDVTGITIGRLFGLGFMILLLRRIPAILLMYKLMPGVCANWKEALFMGYFGPIGVGAVFYLEHTRVHMYPDLGFGNEEETILMQAIGPVVMWLVLFSVVVHGLSIPILDLIYRQRNVKPIMKDAIETRRLSLHAAPPGTNVESNSTGVVEFGSFSRQDTGDQVLPTTKNDVISYAV